MLQETVSYQADGLSLEGQLFALPSPGPRPGILVFPEAFGLGDNAKARARRLAELGYAALACDLHGEGRFIDDLDTALGQLGPLFENPLRTRLRAEAAHRALAARPEVDPARIAAIGFCFPMPLELARSGADVKAVVGFHTVLTTKAAVQGGIKAHVLVCIGADDPFISAEDRRSFEVEMRGAGADWQMELYGGTVHSFTSQDAVRHGRPDAIRYSAAADKRSWAAMLELFVYTIGSPGTAAPGEPLPRRRVSRDH
ncbi:dienelactone hydrolase family protein [soil metagenome]